MRESCRCHGILALHLAAGRGSEPSRPSRPSSSRPRGPGLAGASAQYYLQSALLWLQYVRLMLTPTKNKS